MKHLRIYLLPLFKTTDTNVKAVKTNPTSIMANVKVVQGKLKFIINVP
jgi:hypothetical protein